VLAIDENPSTTTGSTYTDTCPAHAREHGVSVAILEKATALSGIPEHLDGVLETVCQGI
jgi:hypothetical protein